jgi:hypothetical protein
MAGRVVGNRAGAPTLVWSVFVLAGVAAGVTALRVAWRVGAAPYHRFGVLIISVRPRPDGASDGRGIAGHR